MSQVSRYIPAPYGGVSQAAPLARQPEQCEALEDCMVAIPQGATKRPPFSGQALLKDHPGTFTGLFEPIEREGSQDVILTVTNESGSVVPRVYPFAGLPQDWDPAGYASVPITIQPAAQAYLDYGNPVPNEDLVALTVEDYTFLLNRKVPVDILRTTGTPQTETVRAPEAMLWVRLSAYARTYTISVIPDGGTPVTVTLTTPNGAATTDAKFVDTDVIAAAMISGSGYTFANGAALSGDLASLAADNFNVTRIGGVIYLQRTSGGDFTVTVEDGQGGIALTAIKTRVQRFSDLPAKAIDGFVVRITQQAGSEDDDFYVKFAETAGTGTGTWEETIGPGAQKGIDPATMPVGLYYDGSWKLDVLGWKQRAVGDETLAPDPDFVGQALQDLNFWRGRLAAISGEGITLSAAEDPFRFYPKTLSTVLADDPVSLISPYPDVSTIRYGIPFDSRLVGFGDIAQVQVTAEALINPTARIDVMTTYEFSPAMRPQASNGKLYFLAPHGEQASTVYELAVDRITNVTDADDLTTNLPRYVPAGVDRVANCPVNFTLVYGVSGGSQLYPHLFRYQNRERIQNAFDRWNLPEGFTLGGMFFRNTRLYLLACKDDYGIVVMADLAPDLLDPDPASRILSHLDFRVTEDQVVRAYDATEDYTTITLPYAKTDRIRAVSRAPGGVGGPALSEAGPLPAPEGTQATVLEAETALAADNEVVLSGDWSTCPMWFGFQYVARFRPSRWYALAQDGTPIRSGRFSVRRMAIDLADTGYLRVEVQARGRAIRPYIFEGGRYNDPSSLYGSALLATTVWTVPLMSENEQLTVDFINDTHLPMKVLGYELRGELNPKANRL